MQPNRPATTCFVQRLGLVDYQEAWEEQRRLVEACRHDGHGRLLLLEHPPTYTLGVRGKQEHLLLSEASLAKVGATVHRVDRGGDVTFHGPGQLVGYPILDIRRWGQGPVWYVRSLEAALIDALATFGIDGERKKGQPGVWVDGAKIAAIGVRVSRGITSHGFALNVEPDLGYFSYIVPCGMPDAAVTSMAQIMRRRTMSRETDFRPTFATPSRGPDRPEGLSLQETEKRSPVSKRREGRPGWQEQQWSVKGATLMDAVMDAVVEAFERSFPVDVREEVMETRAAS